MKKIIFATKNKGKLKEVKNIFEGSPFEIIEMDGDVPEIIEDKETFRENALKKAETVFRHNGLPAVADDSGLEVEQLGGKPGVISARYAGQNATDEENNAKLLDELINMPEPHKARFVCAAVYYDDAKVIHTEGVVNGRIILQPRGDQGFGYDPLFVPDGFHKTMGELELSEKNKLSHRSMAFRQLKEILEKTLE